MTAERIDFSRVQIDNKRVSFLHTFSKLFVIAGPCVIEGEEHAHFIATALRQIARRLDLNLIFKASFDKANRSSTKSFRGPGLIEGLRILKDIRAELGIPVLSDVHEVSQVEKAAEALDIIQVPAFLSRQTDLLIAAGQTGKIVNVKKGQFMAPREMANVVAKLVEAGCYQIMLTERGFQFGYNNLVVDFRSFPILAELGSPVIFDVTHSVQLPGGAGTKSAGEAQYIPMLARAGAATNSINGFFFEVHENPEAALSDGANALRLDQFEKTVIDIMRIRTTVGLP